MSASRCPFTPPFNISCVCRHDRYSSPPMLFSPSLVPKICLGTLIRRSSASQNVAGQLELGEVAFPSGAWERDRRGDMSQGRRWVGVGLLSAVATCLTGCVAPQSASLLKERGSLAADLAREESPRLARLQQAEVSVPKLAAPMPPLPPQAPTTDGTMLPAPPPSGTKQASLSVPSSRKVTVRAWVNGKPIFDDEVMQSLPRSAMRELGKLSESLRTEKLTELFNQALDQIIEQEVVYQEAVRKLEKVNPRTLEKLKTLAEQEFEKGLKPLVNTPGVSADEVNEFKRIMRRPTERSFISMEYMRSRIFPLLQQAISY